MTVLGDVQAYLKTISWTSFVLVTVIITWLITVIFMNKKAT